MLWQYVIFLKITVHLLIVSIVPFPGKSVISLLSFIIYQILDVYVLFMLRDID